MAIGYPLAVSLCLLLALGGCASSSHDNPATAPTNAETATAGSNAALTDLQRQASRGNLDSQFQLGSQYFVSQPKNLKQAEYWWKQAADKGHALAAVSLAFLYTGRDAPALNNPPLMLKYLNQSAAGGNHMAQHILGTLYLTGEQGVPRDPLQARALFQSACQQHYAPSCEALSKTP